MNKLWLLVPILFLCGCPPQAPKHKTETYAVTSLRSKDVPVGTFVLASGSFGEVTKYKFFCQKTNESGQTELLHFEKTPDEITIILTENQPPTFTVTYVWVEYWAGYSDCWVEALPGQNGVQKPILSVPKNAIVQTVELKP